MKNVLIALLFSISVTLPAIGAETPKPVPTRMDIVPCEIGRAPYDPARQWDPNTEFLVKSPEERVITMKFRKGDTVGESTCKLPAHTILVGKKETGCVDAVYECFNTLIAPRDWCFLEYKEVKPVLTSQPPPEEPSPPAPDANTVVVPAIPPADPNAAGRAELSPQPRRRVGPVTPRPGDPNSWFDFGKPSGSRDLPEGMEIARDKPNPRFDVPQKKLSVGAKWGIGIAAALVTAYACSQWDACEEVFVGEDDPIRRRRGPANPPPPVTSPRAP